ncbi:NHL repeat-containing protein 2 [Morella rubra]|uniref:NHL repeat-containing protein 2 n=1 Tax=Morella rubra TaxID=262757 RepID=A0A6A1WQ38_9ROSI|nr:NHL repeat-containing protein 2 [Morella rubra]
MALNSKLLLPPPSSSSFSPRTALFHFSANPKGPRPISLPSYLFHYQPKRLSFLRKMSVRACVKVEEKNVQEEASGRKWGKVSAVLFDMDGVLCNSEEPSRRAAVDVFAEMGVEVTVEDFVPFMGTGEANFLGGVASVKGVKGFNPEAAKKRFFEIYLDKYAKPNSGIGFPGALELITQCKSKGLKVAVASSADRIKVDANLAAAGLPLSMFDAIVSADAFENLKPAPDIFFAASKILNVPPSECIVIEDALAGVQAATAAQMRCIAVKTTLSEETLKTAGPSLIRKEIGNVSLQDILSGGSDGYNEKIKGNQFFSTSTQTSPAVLPGRTDNGSIQDRYSSNGGTFPIGGLQGSRRDIVKYGSLGVAISCLLFTITNWKAMQYASPKAIWNLLFGVKQPSLEPNAGESRFDRIQQFVNYISDLETKSYLIEISEMRWASKARLFSARLYFVLDLIVVGYINIFKYAKFTVVGVHSAKFDNEKDLEAIRNAVLRYGITHPVVNDGEMTLWRELGVNSWPTFAIVGPNGKLIAQISGEGHRKDLDDLVEAALLFYGRKKILDNKPIPIRLEKDNDPRLLTSPLKFPGKLAIDALNNRLFISDSNHNRIVVTDLDGNFIIQIGTTGEEGLLDGNFDDATFNRPQGLAYNPKKNLLYVADTENHALSPRSTSFAQPSGISLSPDLTVIYVADSESSSIRALDLKTGGSTLLAGGDPVFSDNLFKFGDHDGVGSEVLLQHPLGVLCAKDGQIYIADSYNHKIKKLDPTSKRVSTLAGTGKAGFKDGTALTAQLSEPSGITASENGRLFIADTNNSIIRYLDLNKEVVELLTLELKGVQPPMPKGRSLKRLRRRSSADTKTITVDGGSSNDGSLSLKILLPEEYHLSKEARSKFGVESEPENSVIIDPSDGYLSPEGSAILHFRRSSPSASLGRINCKVYYCKEDELCLYQSLSFEVPFQEANPEAAPAEIALAYSVKPKTQASTLQLSNAR